MGLFTDLLWAIYRPKPSPPPYKKPGASVKTVYLPAGYTIKSLKDAKATGCSVERGGETIIVDGGWKVILDCKKQKGDGSQNEHQDPVARCETKVKWMNCWFRNVKNALTFDYPNGSIQDCVFLDIGEDAVANTQNGENLTVRNVVFLNSVKGDKSLQINNGLNADVRNCTFYLGRTAIRLGEKSYNVPGRDKGHVRYCTFIGVDTCFNISSISANIDLPGHTYSWCRKKYKLSNGATLI